MSKMTAKKKLPARRIKPAESTPADTTQPRRPKLPKKMSWGELKIRYRRREGDDAWGGGE